jgi:hypothetical protein
MKFGVEISWLALEIYWIWLTPLSHVNYVRGRPYNTERDFPRFWPPLSPFVTQNRTNPYIFKRQIADPSSPLECYVLYGRPLKSNRNFPEGWTYDNLINLLENYQLQFPWIISKNNKIYSIFSIKILPTTSHPSTFQNKNNQKLKTTQKWANQVENSTKKRRKFSVGKTYFWTSLNFSTESSVFDVCTRLFDKLNFQQKI